jgi:hypothetical protein
MPLCEAGAGVPGLRGAGQIGSSGPLPRLPPPRCPRGIQAAVPALRLAAPLSAGRPGPAFRYSAKLSEPLKVRPVVERFAAFVAASNYPGGAVDLLRQLGRLLDANPGFHARNSCCPQSQTRQSRWAAVLGI